MFDLTLHIVHESFTLASIVEHKSCGTLFLDEKARRFQLGITEPHVLVQVVETVQKVSHVSTKHAQDAVITVLAYKVDKLASKFLHDLIKVGV